MKKENKINKESKKDEEPCCADSNVCSTDCIPKSKKKESKCSSGGCCS